MKKTILIAGSALLLATASIHAQTDSTQTPATQTPVTTTTTHQDKYNNWTADTYKMQPMPDALTTEKIFPVLGKYNLTDKDGNAATVSISLDETNKGIVWIEGLPQGKIKAALRKSPSTYKIPVQKLDDGTTEATMAPATDATASTSTAKTKNAKDAKKVEEKQLPEGVLVYDKDANVMNLCIGCTYNVDDPAVAFNPPAEPEVVDQPVAKKGAKVKKASVKKEVAKIKPVIYTGSKVIDNTASVSQ